MERREVVGVRAQPADASRPLVAMLLLALHPTPVHRVAQVIICFFLEPVFGPTEHIVSQGIVPGGFLGTMETFRGVRRRRRRPRVLLLAAVLSSAAGPRIHPQAQQAAAAACGSATPLRVENAAGATALSAAVDCADGGEVEAIWAGVVTLDTPISIGSGTFLSITGEDSLAEAQGGAQVRLFTVSSGGGLALTDLRLSGGAAVSGGAVHATSATVTLDGCVFEQNDATAGDGGAVWAEGGELTITGGEFLGNSAVGGNGGAVLAVDGAVVIQDGTRFEENRAFEGGALYCGGAENTTSGVDASCSLSDAVFRLNNASSEVILDYDTIEAPWVNLYGGGGAAFYRGAVGMTDSVFEFNYAQLSGGGVYGGADSDMVINGCRFEENTTPGYGGAMAASSATLGGGTLVKNNSAESNGAGVSPPRLFSQIFRHVHRRLIYLFG